MAQDTLLGFPAHTLPYRRGEFTTLSTVSKETDFSVSFFWDISLITAYQAELLTDRILRL